MDHDKAQAQTGGKERGEYKIHARGSPNAAWPFVRYLTGNHCKATVRNRFINHVCHLPRFFAVINRIERKKKNRNTAREKMEENNSNTLQTRHPSSQHKTRTHLSVDGATVSRRHRRERSQRSLILQDLIRAAARSGVDIAGAHAGGTDP